MDYSYYNDTPPPLDNVSSAGGTEGDLEEFDFDVNTINNGASTSQKHYKSFQPTITLQPSDLVYREEHSRAAPRKGFEPRAFLTIGETKQEHVQYVGRSRAAVTENAHKSKRQTVSASPKKYNQFNQRQSSVHSAPPTNRNKSRVSRAPSGRGRQSGWTSPGYTPLPVAPPPVLPPRENTYVIHPFKQDLSNDNQKIDPTARRPVSPGEEMKQATILATMEVGRFINQREKTPKPSKYREPRLLKARLRPLNTVNVDGPLIQHCQGVQSDRRTLGPSPMKTKQQKQLDDVIKKNAAIKDMPSATYGSRSGSSKAGEFKRKSATNSRATLKTPNSTTGGNLREPTPSPYSSTTRIDKVGNEEQDVDEKTTTIPPNTARSRPLSAAQSEASHTEQQTIARSVSAVTIRQKENVTPSQSSKPTSAQPKTPTVNLEGEFKGTIFITDGDSVLGVASSMIPSQLQQHDQQKQSSQQPTIEQTQHLHSPRQQPRDQQQKEGCKEFKEKASSHRDDKDDDSRGDDNTLTNNASHPARNTGGASGSSNKQQQSLTPAADNAAKDDEVLVDNADSPSTNSLADFPSPPHQSLAAAPTRQPSGADDLPLRSDIRAKPPLRLGSASSLRHVQAPSSAVREIERRGATFITAGFLTLESMITKARNTLRHSYSLNDLDKSCDWGEPIGSPRSVEVLNKEVTFADDAECYYYDPVVVDELKSEELQLMLYNDTALDLVDIAECGNEANADVAQDQKPALPQAKSSCLDSIQRELAGRDSRYGVHGELSEYLTSKTLIRQIFPPDPKPPQWRISPSTHALGGNPLSLNLSPDNDLDPSECGEPVNPPPTPFTGTEIQPPTPSADSAICDWEFLMSDLEFSDTDKCFLETIIDFMPDGEKAEEACRDGLHARAPTTLPDAIEGRVKPVNHRKSKGVVEPIATVAPACFRINHLPPEGCVFYFAYDADMNHNRFSTLLGRKVEDKRWALLFGFQLVFNKRGVDSEAGLFANIEANPYTSTEGSLYTISVEELAAIDGFHGYPDHYARLILPVWACNSLEPENYNIAQYCVPAVTYTAQNRWISSQADLPASKDYSLRQCINGADQLTTGFKEHLNVMLQECT